MGRIADGKRNGPRDSAAGKKAHGVAWPSRTVRRVRWEAGRLATSVCRRLGLNAGEVDRFESSGDYWEQRYARGGRSGAGSRGKLAAFKADVVNGLIQELGITSVVEFGSGDGDQLARFKVERYLGLDISPTAVQVLRRRFDDDPRFRFKLYRGNGIDAAWRSDLALSLDVIYHLVEDAVFEQHVQDLFDAAERYVLIYSSNEDRRGSAHVRHRRFVDYIESHVEGWSLERMMPNPMAETSADFFLFHRTD